MAPIDGVVAAILVVAVARGLALGMIREAFSIAALAGAVIAVRFGTEPLAAWLGTQAADAGYAFGGWTLRVAAAVLWVVAVVAAVGFAGRMLRRGARAVGLGWADRVGGGMLGAAEGLLVAGLLVGVAAALLGRDHEALADSRALATLDQARQTTAPPPVAARD
jgi:membrane protein required for colicin V production